MSVTTDADRKLEAARENIAQAYDNLRDFLDPDTWGSNEYNDKFKEKVEKTTLKLLKIKSKL